MSGGVDRVKLTKIMRMTESSSDGEALAAVRLANRMLAEIGITWADVLAVGPSDRSHLVPPSRRGSRFNSKPSGSAYGRRAQQGGGQGDNGRNTGDEIDEWLTALRGAPGSLDFKMFIGSVTDFWEKRGYLTDAQYAAVRRGWERLGRG